MLGYRRLARGEKPRLYSPVPSRLRPGSALIAAVLVLLLASACSTSVSGREAARRTAVSFLATVTAAPPTPVPTPAPPSAAARFPYLGPTASLAQGGTLIVRIARDGAASAITSFLGHDDPMLADGDDFWVPVGATADTPPGANVLTIATYDAQGAPVGSRRATVVVTATDYPSEDVDLSSQGADSLEGQQAALEDQIRARVFSEFIPQKLWESPFIVPVSGPVTSPFGIGRAYNGGAVTGFHPGTDIAADAGTPVRAAASGRVAFMGLLPSRGLSVIIDHGLGVFTGYHHLSKTNVTLGQSVTQGEAIGEIGSTGASTGPHLHWELIVGGLNVDAMSWTSPAAVP